MALAECLHHSAQRPKMARAGERYESHFTATIRDSLLTQPELFDVFDEEPATLSG